MGKHVRRDYIFKKRIVEEVLGGKYTYSEAAARYGISNRGTISIWKKKYLEGTLGIDNRGKRNQEVTNEEILKKCYALLMKIRSKQQG
ncbi:transposase [Mycoplasmatota bacterium WC44]